MDDTKGSPRGLTRTLFELLFTNRTTIAVISVVLLVAISALPNLGVIAGWAFILVALLVCSAEAPGYWPPAPRKRSSSSAKRMLKLVSEP
jgi:hypothetical protein